MMEAMQQDFPSEAFNSNDDFPDILLSGDNTRTALSLHQALLDQGFRVQFAAAYSDLEMLWKQQRHSVVLLEVSDVHSVEAAVNAAIQLKRHDPRQFVGYLADPILRISGLAGDAIFPRTSEQLAIALRNHFRGEA
jgi:hypothetical protein